MGQRNMVSNVILNGIMCVRVFFSFNQLEFISFRRSDDNQKHLSKSLVLLLKTIKQKRTDKNNFYVQINSTEELLLKIFAKAQKNHFTLFCVLNTIQMMRKQNDVSFDSFDSFIQQFSSQFFLSLISQRTFSVAQQPMSFQTTDKCL